MEELTALARTQWEYHECSFMCFTETWLKERMPDSVVALNHFYLARGDRCAVETGKSKGGGLALFVNECWSCPGRITVKEKLCNKDIELLAVGMRPYYLPREFSYVISIQVYIPTSANVSNACEHINTVTARMQSKYPQALIISGDFNQLLYIILSPPLLSMWTVIRETIKLWACYMQM